MLKNDANGSVDGLTFGAPTWNGQFPQNYQIIEGEREGRRKGWKREKGREEERVSYLPVCPLWWCPITG